MSTLADNFERVEARIVAACQRSGRARADVELVAVSKLHPARAIEEAYAVGQRHFGENYAQELRDKHEALAHLRGVRWHAIGPLQPKNAKYVARAAHFFHALERLDVAHELSRRRTGDALDCFVEVKLSGEATKAGIAPDDLGAFIASVKALPNLNVVGLMGMPPADLEANQARPYFARLASLARAHGLSKLSMGMTGDFEVAIEEGATHLRVGTALFGPRSETA